MREQTATALVRNINMINFNVLNDIFVALEPRKLVGINVTAVKTLISGSLCAPTLTRQHTRTAFYNPLLNRNRQQRIILVQFSHIPFGHSNRISAHFLSFHCILSLSLARAQHAIDSI